MEIQWPLVLFTLLTGMGGCMFLFVCINQFVQFSKKDPFVPALVSFAVTVVGGFASVLHLSHAERIMNALGRPASGIFIEAALIGAMCLFVAIFLVMAKRGASASAMKAVAVLGAAFGVALSFMAGHSYIMIAYDVWNTLLLPLGYLGTALVMGAALYWLVACADSQNGFAWAAVATAICGLVALVTVLLYALASGAFALSASCYVASLVACAVTALLGIAAKGKPSIVLPVAALVAALVAGACFRAAMWAVGVGAYGFFM